MPTRYFMLLFIGLVLSLTACRNRDVEPVKPKSTAWSTLDSVGLENRSPLFQYENKIGIFAYADQRGLALGVPTGYRYLEKVAKSYEISGGFYDYTAKPVLSHGFYFMTPPAGSFLLFKPIYDNNTYWRDGVGRLSLQDIDPTLSFPANRIPVSQVVGRGNLGRQFCAYNDQQQLLVLVEQRGSDYAYYESPYLLTFDYRTEVFPGGERVVTGVNGYKVNKLRIEPDKPGIEIYDVLSSGSTFLLSAYAGLGKNDSQGRPTYRYVIYKVKPDGSYQSVLKSGDIITNLFRYADKLYGYNYFKGIFWESTDSGDTWRQLPNVLDGISGDFYEVAGRLIFSQNGNLYELDFKANSTRKIYTKELTGNLITGVAQYNENVYVSTLGGFFTKKLLTFCSTRTIISSQDKPYLVCPD